MNLVYVDAGQRFLDTGEGSRPNAGLSATSLSGFQEAARLGKVDFGAGTLYPDVVEGSGGWNKDHHNVGGLPEDMQLIDRALGGHYLRMRYVKLENS